MRSTDRQTHHRQDGLPAKRSSGHHPPAGVCTCTSYERRLNGAALRVPVENGSISDLACELSVPASAAEVNAPFAAAAAAELSGVLRYTEAPIVSRDIVGDPASCVFDAGLTQAAGTKVKIFGWYDNEWGLHPPAG